MYFFKNPKTYVIINNDEGSTLPVGAFNMIKIEHYFILNNSIILDTKNLNIKNNLEDCFYIERDSNSKLYISEKMDNKWIKKEEYHYDYEMLINFIINNSSKIICISGFNRTNIIKLITDLNKIKNMNIKVIKFKNDLKQLKYERHLMAKKSRMKKLHKKLKKTNEVQTVEEYMKILNSVLNERKHASRKKILQLKIQ